MRAFLFVWALVLGAPAHAIQPHWKFATLRTAHFDIIYKQEQKELAKIYAKVSEQAYQLLLPIFAEAPNRTVVVLQDDTDQANGLATFIPYPMIVINPVLPLVNESISDYGDWAFEIMVHEYTHVLNQHPVHGVIRPFSYIFGTVVRPNGILPRWYLEGLAVNTESRLSNFGRLRSPDFGAGLRAISEGLLFEKESIDRINETSIPQWPYGNRPYLLGSAWWHEAYRDTQVPYDLNQRYSRRVPFFINGPLESRIKNDASEVLDRAYARLEKIARDHFAAIEKSGGEDSQFLEGDGFADLSLPSISPNGLYLVYVAKDYGVASYIRIVVRKSLSESFHLASASTLTRTQGTSRMSWLPDSSGIVFDQIDSTRPRVTYRDLYLQPVTGTPRRLSIGLRSSEPAVSPSGKQIAYIQSQGGRTSLAQMDIVARKSKILYRAEIQRRLAQPVYHEGKIYFLSRKLNAGDELLIYDFATGKVTSTHLPVQSIFYLASSNKGLVLGSAQTGAANMYLWKGQSLEPITNTKTELSSATVDTERNELIATRLTSSGNRLAVSPIQTTRPPQLAAFYTLPNAPPRPEISESPEEMSYQPYRYLLPRYWIPFIYPVEGGMLFQGQTFNADPIGRNTYSVNGSYDTITQKGGYGVSYQNSSTPTDLDISYSKFQNYLGASNLTLENQHAELGAGFYLSSMNKYWRGRLNGSWSQTESQSLIRRIGPGAEVSYSRLDNPYKNHGASFLIKHQEYLSQSGYVAYGITSASVTFQTGTGATNSQHLKLTAKGALAPRLPLNQYVVTLGERNLGANYLVNLSGSDYLLRGYPSGTFVGRKLVNANFEYDFPVAGIWSGSGTLPLFFRNLRGSIFYDVMALDGAAWRPDENPAVRGYYATRLGEFYSGTGVEFRLNTTAAYHLPLTITLGLYYGLKEQYSGGFTPFFGIGYQGLE